MAGNPSLRLIPNDTRNGKKRRGGMEDGAAVDALFSKSLPANFYGRKDPPPAPRHRPLKSRQDPESFSLPPPSPLDQQHIQEIIRLGRSLTKTTPAQLLYPSSLPTQAHMNVQRLKALSLSTKKEEQSIEDNHSASSSINDKEEEIEPPQPVGSLGSTLMEILQEGTEDLIKVPQQITAAPTQDVEEEEEIPEMTLDFEED